MDGNYVGYVLNKDTVPTPYQSMISITIRLTWLLPPRGQNPHCIADTQIMRLH